MALTCRLTRRIVPWLCGSLILLAAGPFAQSQPELGFHGVTAGPEKLNRLSAVPGPLPGMVGWEAQAGPMDLTMTADPHVSGRGSLMFWLRTDQTYRAGPGIEEIRLPILSSPGVFEYYGRLDSPMFGLFWDWSDAVDAFDSKVLIPGLPGPAWHHIAFEWDAKKGILNSYLNGTPLRVPGTTFDAWTPKAIQHLQFRLGSFAVSDFRLSGEMIEPRELEQRISRLYYGSLDYILGSRALGPATFDDRKGNLLYSNPLGRPANTREWKLEGPANVTYAEGWMKMASHRPDGPNGHIVHWCPVDFPESYIVEWEIQPLSFQGLCIVFFSARGRNGEDIFDPSLQSRDGIFSRYIFGDIDCYHISYYANTPGEPGRLTSNLRKNHGFFLAANGSPGIPPGSSKVHRVQLMKDASHVQLAVDGRLIVDFFDDGETYGPVHGGGKIGLRQMQWMEARYRNFRVYEVRD